MTAQTISADTADLGIRPLTGSRVVTIALNVPGPMAAERLCALGATVTKIEPPDGDPLKVSCPPWYAELTRGLSVETLDLKTDAGKARMYRLLEETDLLLTSQRPSALARLGLAWTELHARFPALCQVAIVGHAAPEQEIAGHDLTYLAANDLLTPPALPPTLFADVGGSEQATIAALATLLEQRRTGTGQYVEVALAESAKRLAAPRRAGLTEPGKILGGAFPGYNLYRTKDGWVALAALEQHFYRRLCQRLDVPVPSCAAFAERFSAHENNHWARLAAEHDLPIAVIAESGDRDK